MAAPKMRVGRLVLCATSPDATAVSPSARTFLFAACHRRRRCTHYTTRLSPLLAGPLSIDFGYYGREEKAIQLTIGSDQAAITMSATSAVGWCTF
jgi:hypothetical protein